MNRINRSTCAALLVACFSGTAHLGLAKDLSKAVVVIAESASPRQAKAVAMLVEETQKRTGIGWATSHKLPTGAGPAIVVGLADEARQLAPSAAGEIEKRAAAEGFEIASKKLGETDAVLVVGNDERGVLFGIGQLLRAMRLSPGKVELADNYNIVTAPKYPLRGHQLGYRPKTNSYDAWDLPQWEQYYRDLAVFGSNAVELGSLAAMDEAERVLNRATEQRVAPTLRARVFELAEALFKSIQMQTSVPKYQAIAVDRGATLDTVDYPLNNRRWLVGRFGQIRQLSDEPKRVAELDAIARWTDPGPGGFYDDLGKGAAQPHLVPGLPYAEDPAFLRSSRIGFEEGDDMVSARSIPWRESWIDYAESLLEQPLKLRYADLDPSAEYKLRVVYAGDGLEKDIRLMANDSIEIHPLIKKPFPVTPIEFDIPRQATAGGQLNLSWYRVTGLGDNGRGSQVSEVWLIKKP